MPRHPIRRTLGVVSGFLFLFFAIVFAIALFLIRPGGREALLPLGASVAVIPLEGEITQSDEFVEAIKRLGERADVRAVVVRINSPGGGVAPSQEMYGSLRRLGQHKPVVASLGSVAASGGYYVASAADVIVASPGSLTGSIGVILPVTNVTGLLDKIGVQATVVKAGSLKDMGSPLRAMTPEEQALLQQLIDEVHQQFIDAVAAGRKMDADRARSLADGRVFSGQQAKQAGLVDELGGLEDAIRIAAERAGMKGEPKVEHVSPRRAPWWWRFLVSDEAPIRPAKGSILDLFWSAQAIASGNRAPGTGLLWRLPIVTEGFQ
jgi:protease-4